MPRRILPLLSAVLAVGALHAGPALAGEDDPDGDDAPSATLHATQGCVGGQRARVVVTGTMIDSVTFHLDGVRMKSMAEPDEDGAYTFTIRCRTLVAGAHRGKAVVSFDEEATPARRTLRFQIARVLRGTPRFAG